MVDSLVSTVGEKLKAALQEEVNMLVSVKSEIKKLSKTFTFIQTVLQDAESRRVMEGPVNIWLEQVKDVAYDVEDILDEWKTEALRPQAPYEGDVSCFSFLVTCFLFPVTCFNYVKLRHEIGSKIKEVRGRLDQISKDSSELRLIRVDSGVREKGDSEVRREEIKRREISSLIDQSSMVGRDGDKNEVLDILLGESSGEVNGLPIIVSIVGMGGWGKTALAQLIYNDEKVKKHFDMRMFVCVSEDFDVKQITKLIIESATESSCQPLDLGPLQNRLYEMLHAKRFLLVLDDIWSENSLEWENLRPPFQAGALGSRIVITTRSEKVALAMGNGRKHKLAVLSDDDCWLLFSRRALEHRSAEERLALEKTGREIVKKCGGVPLAAKTIGSVMRMSSESQWDVVLKSEIWKSSHDLLPALLFSYRDLTPALKQCFAYLSIFPKGWWMEKDAIVKLWVANGFISSNESANEEKIGERYFNDLLSRSLLQDAELDGDKNIYICKMHDLVHDLAQFVAGSNCSVVEIGKQALSVNLNSVRHSLLIASHEAGDETNEAGDETNEADEMASILATQHKAQKLRTLLIKSRSSWERHRVPQKLFQHLRCIRALDLSHAIIEKLPKTVGQLKHLRYLDLSCTEIEELPEEVTHCGNLRTLRLYYCCRLRKLPREMRKMISLRHIELEGTDLKYLPQGIGRLTGLQTLTNFVVGVGDEECKCEELKHLNHLQGRLQITGLENVRIRDEAREAELYNKQNLHALSFDYNDDDAELLDDEVKRMEDVLEILQPHTNLKIFEIYNYKGFKFPKWIEDPAFCNLVRVRLSNCDKWKQLPGLGKLPSLKYLDIGNMEEVRKVGGEFRGDDDNEGSGGLVSFPKLETLGFWNMANLEEWELSGGDGEVMPSLLHLTIHNCIKLELPSNLPPLLQKLSLNNMSNEGMLSGGPLPIHPSLKHLEIDESPELTSIPGGWLGQFKALQTLDIASCERLGSLPEELQQLTVLQDLNIYHCPLLVERYGYGGEDWDKIAHIPNITI